jgi:arylsulfatase
MALQAPERCLAQYKDQFDDIPYQAEDGYLPNRYPKATYAAMISLLDEYVGDLRRVLKENGLDKNTVVIFTADNGAAATGGCDPDYFHCSGDLRGRKGSLYEGGIKVPFIAWWPGVVKSGATSDHVCAIWDLMPTFLEIAGTAPGMPVDGISFLAALKQEPQKQHEFLYWERHSANGETHTQAVRFGDWKAIKQIKTNSTMLALYNLKKDPTERHDVATSNPDLVDKAESCFKTRRLAVVQDWNFIKPGKE